MCGICGYISLVPDETPSREDLARMTASLRHRGPDDEGMWQKDGVGLGHRRLSIIDLSPLGHQPMSTAGTSTHIVFNGEIYNFQEVREELRGHGCGFHTRSDTEVILRAYDVWGEECVSRFNGMFAIAIYDEARNTLFLARDRIGVKPLYYAFDGRHFIFGSELKALHAHPHFRRTIDRRAVEHYFAYKYVRAPDTIWQKTWKLLPGHTLTFRDGTLETRPYWNALDQERTRHSGDGRDAALLEEFRPLFADAVRLRMISDVPLGVLLSGGIDSSLVTAEMSRQSSRIKTFAIGFTEDRYNEAPYARAIAHALGTDHHELILRPEEVFAAIEVLAEHFDEPFGDPSSLPTYLVSKLAREHVTVALSGDGGDESFWGYARYAKYRAALRFGAMPLSARRVVFGALSRFPHDLVRKASQGLQYRSADEAYEYLNAVFKGDDLQRLFLEPVTSTPHLFPSHEARFPIAPLDRPAMMDLLSYLPDDVLVKVDRASMAVALEARAPLLDYRIVEFGLRTPLASKVRGGVQKVLLRKLLGEYLDPRLFERPKRGFDLPLNSWFRRELRTFVLDRLSPDRLRRFGLFNVPFIQSILEQHMSGSRDFYYMIWSLLSFDLWYERFVERSAHSETRR